MAISGFEAVADDLRRTPDVCRGSSARSVLGGIPVLVGSATRTASAAAQPVAREALASILGLSASLEAGNAALRGPLARRDAELAHRVIGIRRLDVEHRSRSERAERAGSDRRAREY